MAGGEDIRMPKSFPLLYTYRALKRGGREHDFLGRLGEHGRLEIPEFHEGKVGLVHVENLLNGRRNGSHDVPS